MSKATFISCGYTLAVKSGKPVSTFSEGLPLCFLLTSNSPLRANASLCLSLLGKLFQMWNRERKSVTITTLGWFWQIWLQLASKSQAAAAADYPVLYLWHFPKCLSSRSFASATLNKYIMESLEATGRQCTDWTVHCSVQLFWISLLSRLGSQKLHHQHQTPCKFPLNLFFISPSVRLTHIHTPRTLHCCS